MSQRGKSQILSMILIVGGIVFSGGVGVSAAGKPTKEAVILRDASLPPVVFAAGEIRKALEELSFAVAEKPLEAVAGQTAPVRIILAVDSESVRRQIADKGGTLPKAIGEQGYALRRTATPQGTDCWVIGGDAVGAMYGGLHVAEAIRLDKGLDAIGEGALHKPFIARRGIKFNIPLDARTPSYDDTGDAAQSNYAEMWNFEFWVEFLDDMARHRYNNLTLWNPHPFPSIVKLPNYPDVALDDVCVTTLKPTHQGGAWSDPMGVSQEVLNNLKVVKKMSIDEKIDFWRRVMKHARDRGIDVYFITWNVLVNGAEGKYGITGRQDDPKTIAYMRECVHQTILTYPLLTGIGVTAGERMQDRKDDFSKEKWLWNTYGLGILDAKKEQPQRTVRFIHRIWQTGVEEVVKDFGSKYPDPFELGFKYARAHMYSSTKPPFCEQLCQEMAPHDLKCWWNLRNDDIFNFRWGDPDYARDFLKNLPPENLTAAYHMGSDGYVWGREFTSLEPDSPRQLEIKKHWYNFMLWGRLGYDPSLDRRFFEKVLARRFPEAGSATLYEAWATASKIIPLVNRFHWCDWDFMWAVEGCMDQRQGFHTVRDFIRVTPMERSGIISIADYVEGAASGKPAKGITPIEVADELQRHADDSVKMVGEIRRDAPGMSKELRHTLGDLEAMASLGRYYACKIRGAVELCAFERSKNASNKEKAVEHLQEAVKAWQEYARVASSLYRPQLLARTRLLDWNAALDDVRKDVEIARSAK